MLHLRRAAPLLRRAPPPPRRLRHAALAGALGTDRQRWGLGAALALGGVGVGAVGAQPAEAAAFTSETAKAANRRAAEKADDRRRRDVSNLPNSEVAAATYNTTHWRSHANDPWRGAPTSVLWGFIVCGHGKDENSVYTVQVNKHLGLAENSQNTESEKSRSAALGSTTLC